MEAEIAYDDDIEKCVRREKMKRKYACLEEEIDSLVADYESKESEVQATPSHDFKREKRLKNKLDRFSSELLSVEEACKYMNDNRELTEKLKICFGDYNVTRNAQDAIVRILQEHGHPDLQLGQAIMNTSKGVKKFLYEVSGGKMFYSGIESGVRRVVTAEYLSHCKSISLDFFWDGLSPYKSVKHKVWPILCRLSSTEFSMASAPFIVSIFAGNSDPDPYEFLKDFISEAKGLQDNGIRFDDIRYEIEIQKIIADYPARCRMKCVNGEGPSSLIQCERCTIVGRKRAGTNFSSVEIRRSRPTLRTDETFRSKAQVEYHTHHKTGERVDSPLTKLDIDMIFGFPMDPLHILYQGVMRRWWEFIVESKRSVIFRITDNVVTDLSTFMEQDLKKFFPSEFARRVRGMSCYKLFKATEWRRFLLYDGIIVTKKYLNTGAHRNFLLLSCAVRILSSPELFENKNLRTDAESLLKGFVADAESKFGKSFVAIKVHSLTHLTKDAEKHGVLESFSAFPFESYLHRINCSMRAHGRCIEQIVNRIKEGHLLQPEPVKMRACGRHAGAVLSDIVHESADKMEYRKALLPGMLLRTDRRRDSIIKTTDDAVVRVTSIEHDTLLDEVYVLGYKFAYRSNYFHWPIKSKLIGIEKVWGLESVQSKWLIQDVKSKCVLLKSDSQSSEWLCLPLIHDERRE